MRAVELLLELRRGYVPQWLKNALRVEPGAPFQRRELDIVESPPRPPMVSDFGVVPPNDRIGQRIVRGVAGSANGGRGAGVGQAARVPQRDLLPPAVGVHDQPPVALAVK